MNVHSTTHTAGHTFTTRIGMVAVAGAMVLGLAACQTGLRESQPSPAPEPRVAAAAPAGIDRTMTADRIVEALERRAAVVNERFAGMTADNIERALEREAAQSSAEAHGGR